MYYIKSICRKVISKIRLLITSGYLLFFIIFSFFSFSLSTNSFALSLYSLCFWCKDNKPSLVDKPVVAGYLGAWGQITMSDAVKSGYELLIVSYGLINGSDVSMYHYCKNSQGTVPCFGPTANYNVIPLRWKDGFKKDLANAKALNHNTRVVLTFGGGINTFKPYNYKTKTNADPMELAKNLVAYAKELNLDGFSFDLEYITQEHFKGSSQERTNYFYQLVKNIKNLNSKLAIGIAPQLEANKKNMVGLTSYVNERIFDEALSNNLINYIFLQAYNNPSIALDPSKYPDKPCYSAYNKDNIEARNEYKPVFISNVFPCLNKLFAKNSNLKIFITESTKKATKGALYKGTLEQIASNYRIIKDYGFKTFGGAAVWNINDDARRFDFVTKEVQKKVSKKIKAKNNKKASTVTVTITEKVNVREPRIPYSFVNTIKQALE